MSEQKPANNEKTGVVKVIVNLNEETVKDLKLIAAVEDITLTDAFHRAIALAKDVTLERMQGSEILVERKHASRRNKFLRIIPFGKYL